MALQIIWPWSRASSLDGDVLVRRIACIGSLLVLLTTTGCTARQTPIAQMRTATVERVIDGDTLYVMVGGRQVRVRTVQIDAPESSRLRFGSSDRCGAAAKAFARGLVHKGQRVTLELFAERLDKYGRLLAVVHLGGAKAITWQEKMTRAGWAEVFVFAGNRTPWLGRLQVDESYARAHRLGVFALCAGRFHDHAR
jgi:micrococcal nuclease